MGGNHQSYIDIFLLLAIIDKKFLFMAKEELFKIPMFGFAIKALGIIPINRGGESRDALKSLFEAAKKIQDGYSVLLFPEVQGLQTERCSHLKGGVHLH